MALNDPGLQSLSSIAASEFYDVTITDTNSPIEQGDTLVVDYEVSNTGDKTGTQDITLEIEDVLKDTDAGVRVLANRTGSGTLEWVTDSGETAQDYTATVLSADDSATQTVTVEDTDAIPDSVDYYWPVDEGSGSTLSPDVGDVEITLNGPTWVSDSKYGGGSAIQFDGADDWAVLADAIDDINASEVTVGMWVEDVSGGSNAGYISLGDSPSAEESPDGYSVMIDGDDTSRIRVRHDSGGSDSDAIQSGIVDPSQNDVMLVYSADGDQGRIRTWDSDGKVDDHTGSSSRGTTASDKLVWGVRDNDHLGVVIDEIFIATGTEMSDIDLEDFYDETKR